MITTTDLANLIFPDIKENLDDLEARFPKRNLLPNALVTRFAPSPTGFLHTGSLFTAMISKKVASMSNGVFYLRLEDTDTKREIKDSGRDLVSELAAFNVTIDEGYQGDAETGLYGPYKQSERKTIYQTVIKTMLIKGLAYPCFASTQELEAIRRIQEANKELTGYYGKYAIYRNYRLEDAYRRIKNGDPFVIRFKSHGNHHQKIMVTDLIRGSFMIQENEIDVVIYKSDELPTYHFAHVVDDHFMRTTTVIRGEEWISSLPLHLEMFQALDFEAPAYAHLPVIMKLDNGAKRKLSKRHDPEAATSFFTNSGYPSEAIIIYLLSIANSNFEEWLIKEGILNYPAFDFSFDNMSLDGALFDLGKINYFAKEYLAALDKKTLTDKALKFGEGHALELVTLINQDRNYFESIINIERDTEKKRKDFTTYFDILNNVKFFYRDYYLKMLDVHTFNPKFSFQDLRLVIDTLLNENETFTDEQLWFSKMKELAAILNFATNNKLYKEQPDHYRGNISDFIEIYRIAITTSKNSPNLLQVLNVLGPEEIRFRLQFVNTLFV
ncbi:MAG: glutamate--tRNA ligase [Erysipelotrichaceae bacterium]|jgi:glutamyl-tRNA synthetase|nr:glutamate--tRNA ligase [Erysipelotrichaceae bacterium]